MLILLVIGHLGGQSGSFEQKGMDKYKLKHTHSHHPRTHMQWCPKSERLVFHEIFPIFTLQDKFKSHRLKCQKQQVLRTLKPFKLQQERMHICCNDEKVQRLASLF